MSKPKTGKMTDEEIIAQARLEMENGDAEDYDVYERILIGVARQQGRAETISAAICGMEEVGKQAYEKGDGKGLDMKWELCRKRTSTKAVADFKARLMSKELNRIIRERLSMKADAEGMVDMDYVDAFCYLKEALAEATKEGDGK